MRILKAIASNFASYKSIEFKFDSQGLTLVSGPNGSGKSTLCDLVPWALFGVTAKNGAADDVLSWGTQEQTRVEVTLEGTPILKIVRLRSPNDLMYFKDAGTPIRGKDLSDTQKQINSLLGIDSDTFLAGSYFHELSPTAQFFSSTAKNRRQTTEELVDLKLASDLTERLTLYNKDLKKDLQQAIEKQSLQKNSLSHIEKSLSDAKSSSRHWIQNHNTRLTEIENKFLNYETIKSQTIQQLTDKRVSFQQDIDSKISLIRQDIKNTQSQIKPHSYFTEQESVLAKRREVLGAANCKECGGKKNSHKHQVIDKDSYALDRKKSENNNFKIWIQTQEQAVKQLETRVNPYTEQIEKETNRPNNHLSQLTSIKEEVNPFLDSIDTLQQEEAATYQLISLTESEIQDLKVMQSDSELLADIISNFRSTVIRSTVQQLETSVNSYLETYFDNEVRVKFSIESSDKLDVTLVKDGNTCSFTQLSKGQRQLLKLCFAVSVMKQVANHSGTDFNCIFLDECTDGLDENMKVKAFDLLFSLETTYESIFLVEHSEALKNCFNHRFSVELTDGGSVINES